MNLIYIVSYTEFFFIPSFISLYYLNTLFTEKKLSWLIYVSIKELEIRTSIGFKLVFEFSKLVFLTLVFNNILSLSCFFLLIIDLYLLIAAVIGQFIITTAELVIPTGIQTNEANAELKTQPVTVKAKISNF